MFHYSYFTECPNQLSHLLTVQLMCEKQTPTFGWTEVFVIVADGCFNKKIVCTY